MRSLVKPGGQCSTGRYYNCTQGIGKMSDRNSGLGVLSFKQQQCCVLVSRGKVPQVAYTIHSTSGDLGKSNVIIGSQTLEY